MTTATLPRATFGPEVGPVQTKEPFNDGGGNKVDTPQGSIISKLQLGKDPDGTRWINIWHRPLVIS